MDRIVDTDTGEIINLPKNYQSVSYYNSYEIPKGSNIDTQTFFMLVAEFQENLKQRYGISFSDMGRIFFLMSHCGYRQLETKKMYILNGGIYINTNKKLATLLNITTDQARYFKDRIKKKFVLFEDDKGLYFKDDVIIRGKLFGNEKRNLNYYVMFGKFIQELYHMFHDKDDLKSVTSFGFLLALIPFIKGRGDVNGVFSYGSNNMLVISYVDPDTNYMLPLDIKNITSIFAMGRNTVVKYMGDINKIVYKNTGEYMLYECVWKPIGINTKERSAIIINPKLTYTQGENMDAYSSLLDSIANSNGPRIELNTDI